MGVSAFFRWLTKMYPSVICDAKEEKRRELPDERRPPIDTSLPNPNGVEFDNLYLDMNGIIHSCSHPEDRPAPKNEDEMMVAMFEFIDRIFAIVRPRKLLYMAIDGVAPRAKMNQQRSRRFRASQEVAEKVKQMAKISDELRAKGCYVPPQKEKGEPFDSNCITPGTSFMRRLSKCLHYYVHDRLSNDLGWKNLIVILSDANVPGEGEHKIMDYIRRQRAQPNHDPNTKHVLCGADADLIMLGLATHEPHFTIIREELTPHKPRPCDICNQLGHEMKDCQGAEKEMRGEFDEIASTIAAEQKYIFVRLYVLREYLERELAMPNLPFPYDLERAIDDWVFLCFFVGNDFLPHLPSLEIREDAIDRLVRLYKNAVYKTGGWLTESGFVALERVQLILNALGDVEDEIFRKRQQNEVLFLQRQKQNKRRSFGGVDQGRSVFLPSGQFSPRAVGRGYNNPGITNARQEIQQHRQQAFVRESDAVPDNNDAAAKLRAMLKPTADGEASNPTGAGASNSEPAESPRGVKREAEEEEEDEFAHDEVRLWEEGFKERYYESKFGVGLNDIEFRSKVATEYVRGLCWVLQYYYQGVPSWKWYFPYHYAPFASDFQNITQVNTRFPKGEPFLPLEQLMGVLPAASRSLLPNAFAELMVDPKSTIIDFYREDFKIDLNGKKFAWQGVALLPFVDETRLKSALKPLRDLMTEEEKRRNQLGEELVFCGKHHPGYSFLRRLLEGEQTEEMAVFDLNTEDFNGFYGHVLPSDICVEAGGVLKSPVHSLESIDDCHVACLFYRAPIPREPNFQYLAGRLPGAITPLRQLLQVDEDHSYRTHQENNPVPAYPFEYLGSRFGGGNGNRGRGDSHRRNYRGGNRGRNYRGGNRGSGGGSNRGSGDENNWQCPKPQCRNSNYPHRSKCNRCGASRPSPSVAEGLAEERGSSLVGGWSCTKASCGNLNYAWRTRCHKCHHPRFVNAPSDEGAEWTCPSCPSGTPNFAYRRSCRVCGWQKLPDRWLDYSKMGKPMEGYNIVASITPLSEEFLSKTSAPKEKWFSPTDALSSLPQLKLVLDLTATGRYYRPSEFTSHGVQHVKMECRGRELPDQNTVNRVFHLIDNFLEKKSEGDLMLVHCTHGLNRTGYLLSRYLIETIGLSPEVAIKVFEDARGHLMEREEYRNDLMTRSYNGRTATLSH